MLQTKPTAQLGAAARSSTSRAARFRPFTQLSRSILTGAPRTARATTTVRAAETDAAAAPADDFEFNYGDAKKGNEYSTSDVAAALAYYVGEAGSPCDAETDHVRNEFAEGGYEDASFFDEMDNNEAYDDEFVVAGIPEAAPKTKRRDRGEAEGGDDDDIAAAKAATQLKDMEEQMVLEAELQEAGLDQEVTVRSTAVGPAVWDWMADLAVDEEDPDQLRIMARNPARISAAVADTLPSDEQLFADMRSANLQDLDVETKETIEFLLDDFDLENELKAVTFDDDTAALPEVPMVDIAAIDAVLAADLSVPDIPADLLSLADLPVVEDNNMRLEDSVVQDYVQQLKAIKPADREADEVKALFAETALEEVAVTDEAPITLDDPELAEPAEIVLGNLDLPVIEDNLNEIDDVSEYLAEINSLRALPEPVFDMPLPEEVEVLDQYLTASEQFLASEEERKMAISQAVARGELPPDALEEEIDEVLDIENELLVPIEDAELTEGLAMRDDDDDGENWQERIIEMSRVTKVVKGGKLMGFRVVAIVGNGKGLVGVGCQSGREVATAVKRALVDAKKSVIRVPLVGAGTIPHRAEAKFHAARCVIVPAADGTGCLAGGAIRSVLELAGVQNVLGKRIGCRSALNNARCTVKALEQLRTLQEVASSRGVPMSNLLLPR